MNHDAQLDVYDYDVPFKINYRIDYLSIDPMFKKRGLIYLKTAEITTDDGILFAALNSQSNIMFQSKEIDIALRRQTTDDPFIQFVIFASKQDATCSRRYQKMPEVLGSLTGIAHLFMFFCMLICNLVMHISYLELLSNKLYVFPNIGNKKNQQIPNSNKGNILDLQNNQTIIHNENPIFCLESVTHQTNTDFHPFHIIKTEFAYHSE